MSVRRRRPLTEPVARAAVALGRAESSIALLDRARPLALAEELARLKAAFERGERPLPSLHYAARASLFSVRRELEVIGKRDVGDSEPQLLVERARELALEAELAEHVGLPEFAALAARRFPLPPDAERVEKVARQLIAIPAPRAEAPSALHTSDDRSDPHSLWSAVSRLLAREGFAARIEIVPGLVSLAAVADGVVRVREGARLTERVGRRIALHEVHGHVRPRALGQALGGVFLAGSAGSSEDEEGRAIWLEQCAGLLDGERLRELARRYLAAASVRRGATLWDTVELLGTTGATAASSIELACRVHRGGGLGRELIYLTGYLRAAEQLTARPELGAVLASGRVSLRAAALLLDDSIELHDDGDVV